MTSDLFDIAGKKAVVTGGGSGIGIMIATGFAEAGVSVIIASRKEDSLKVASEELAKAGECSYVVADLSTEEGCRGLGAANVRGRVQQGEDGDRRRYDTEHGRFSAGAGMEASPSLAPRPMRFNPPACGNSGYFIAASSRS